MSFQNQWVEIYSGKTDWKSFRYLEFLFKLTLSQCRDDFLKNCTFQKLFLRCANVKNEQSWKWPMLRCVHFGSIICIFSRVLDFVYRQGLIGWVRVAAVNANLARFFLLSSGTQCPFARISSNLSNRLTSLQLYAHFQSHSNAHSTCLRVSGDT